MTVPPPAARKWPDLAPAEQRAVLDAIVTMIVVMGGSLSTAYLVAAELAFDFEDPALRPRRWPGGYRRAEVVTNL